MTQERKQLAQSAFRHTQHRLLFKPLPTESTRGNDILHYRMVLIPHNTWQFIFFQPLYVRCV